MKKTLFVVLGLAMTCAPSVVHACEGIVAERFRHVLPDNNPTNFPTNGAVRIYTRSFSPEERSALAQEYRLLDERGAIVATNTAIVRTRIDLVPRAPLQPNARYRVEQLFAYNHRGELLSDTQRAYAPAGQTIRRAWFTVSTFQTGTGPAPARTVTAELREAALDVHRGGGDCGPGIAVTAQMTLGANAADTDFVELEARTPNSSPQVASVGSTSSRTIAFSDIDGSSDPVYVPFRGSIELRLRVFDVAGRLLGTSPWITADQRLGVRGRIGIGPARNLPEDWDHRRRRRHRPSASASAWLASPIVTATPILTQGPPDCSFGLENSALAQIADSPSSNIQHYASIANSEPSPWFVRSRANDPTAQLFQIDNTLHANSLQLPTDPGTLLSLTVDSSGVYTLSNRTEQQSHQSLLNAFNSSGQARWSAPLHTRINTAIANEGFVHSPGQIFVTFTSAQRTIGWTILNDQTGATLTAPTISTHAGPETSSLTSVWTGENYLVLWRSSDPSRPPNTNTMLVSREGRALPPQTIPVEFDQIGGVATAGTQLGVVGTHNGHIVWALLNANGTLARPPVTVNIGTGNSNQFPRIAYSNGLFAVLWEAGPSTATFATVIDAEGRLAPPHRVARNTASTGLFSAGGPSFIGVLTHQIGTIQAVSLTCRRTPVAGPPMSIRY